MLISESESKGVATAQVYVGSEFHSAVNELCRVALAVRVVLGETVAHLSVALHGCISQFTGDYIVQVAEVLRIARPQLAVVHEQVVVVTELVVFSHEAVAVVEVILHLIGIWRIGADGIGVHVVECRCSEHILHRLVVHALVGSSHNADVPCLVFVYLLVES